MRAYRVKNINIVNQQIPNILITISYNGNPLQYSCLENPMEAEPGRTTNQRVAASDTTERLSIDPHGIEIYKMEPKSMVIYSIYIMNSLLQNSELN